MRIIKPASYPSNTTIAIYPSPERRFPQNKQRNEKHTINNDTVQVLCNGFANTRNDLQFFEYRRK
jgi:hypothetical protein